MKLRKGFVSNSSTSSFVIIGYEIDEVDLVALVKKITDKPDEWFDEDGDWIYEVDTVSGFSVFNLSEEGELYIGVQPLDIDENSISEAEIDLAEITTKMDKLKALLGTSESPKIYGGTYAC